MPPASDSPELAPFSFFNGIQRKISNFPQNLKSKSKSMSFNFLPKTRRKGLLLLDKGNAPNTTLPSGLALQDEERRRRDIWNCAYGFGGTEANEAEKEAENVRRREFDVKLQRHRQGSSAPGSNVPLVPCIPTSSCQRNHQPP